MNIEYTKYIQMLSDIVQIRHLMLYLTQYLYIHAFKFCKLLCPCERTSEAQSIKEGVTQLAWTVYTAVLDWLQHDQHGLQGKQ